MGRWIVVFVVALGIWVALQGRHFSSRETKEAVASSTAEGTVDIEALKAKLPMQLPNNLTLETVDYSNHLLHYTGSVAGRTEVDKVKKAELDKRFLDDYCHGKMKHYADGKISMQFDIKYWSPTWGYQTLTYAQSPDQCS